MNVTTTNTDDLNAVLTIEIKPEDYAEKVEKVLKDYRKKANIPGFRPGNVPASLIKKQYGKAVLVDEVNHILQHAVYDKIQEDKLDILGNPLPVEQDDIDWDTQKDFKFNFELGLAPSFELKIGDKIKVPYFKITADKKMVDRYVNDYAKRFGTMSYPEVSDTDSILKADFSELSKDGRIQEEGIQHSASFSLDSISDKKSAKSLVGLKVGDKASINLNKAFNDDLNVANLLSTDNETLKASSGDFELVISEISKLTPAELNQELFDKVFGEGHVNGETEFREHIKQDAEKMFVSESDKKFYEDVKNTLLGKMKFDLPDAFLKKWMRNAGEKPLEEAEVEQQYPDMKDSMKWQLVENKVIKEHKIEVTQEELTDYTKDLVRRQMAQYGQMPEDEQLDGIAKSVMDNKEELQRITDQLFSEKLLSFFKENLKISEKEVSFDEFLKQMK
jgi:trigger factor